MAWECQDQAAGQGLHSGLWAVQIDRPALPSPRAAGGDPGRAGLGAPPNAARSRRERGAERGRACRPACDGRGPGGGSGSRCRSASRAARAHAGGSVPRQPRPGGRARGRARGPSTRTRARLPAPPAARRGRRQWRGGDRRPRSRPRPDRQRLEASRAAHRANRRTSGRSPRTAGACSPSLRERRCAAPRRTGCVRRAATAQRAAGRGRGRGRGEESRERRRRLDELGVDELELLTGRDSGGRERQLAHRRGLSSKPSMPGYVKPRLGRQEPLDPVEPRDIKTEFSNLAQSARNAAAASDAPAAAGSQAPSVHSDAEAAGGLLDRYRKICKSWR